MRRTSYPLIVVVAALVAIAAVLVLASGGGGSPASRPTAATGGCPVVPAPNEIGLPPPASGPADARATVTVCRWAAAEARGEFAKASELFALPALIETPVNGGQVSVERAAHRSDVVNFNAGLPCAAVPLRSVAVSAYTVVSFRLFARRGGAACSGIGNVAFIVRDGLIVAWLRAPDDLSRLRLPSTSGDGTPALPPGSSQPNALPGSGPIV